MGVLPGQFINLKPIDKLSFSVTDTHEMAIKRMVTKLDIDIGIEINVRHNATSE